MKRQIKIQKKIEIFIKNNEKLIANKIYSKQKKRKSNIIIDRRFLFFSLAISLLSSLRMNKYFSIISSKKNEKMQCILYE